MANKTSEELMEINKARVVIIHPFFGILGLKLKLQETEMIPTMATEGRHILYNPEFVQKFPENELRFIIIHEILHAALGHVWRLGMREPEVWNYACDYVVNLMIQDFMDNDNRISISSEKRQRLQRPDGILYDTKYANMSAEEVYEQLMNDPQIQQMLKDKEKLQKFLSKLGNQIDDHNWDNANNGSQENEKLKKEWEKNLVSAAKQVMDKNAGSLPGYLKRLVDNITKPQKDWRVLLHEFVQPEITDYTFNPPDKRFGDFDFFLPDYNDSEDSVKNILFMIDTSGSISDKELQVAYSEIVGAVNQFSSLSGKLGFFDHVVYDPIDFEDVNDVMEIKPQGGGGTNFKGVFEYINKDYDGEPPAAIIILTDGYDTWPDENITDIPTFWLITNEDQIPPWGVHTTLKI